MDTNEKRRRLKAHWRECERVATERERLTDAYYEMVLMHLLEYGRLPPVPVLPPLPSFPDELRGMTCGAKTRAGTPCKQRAIYRNGRCKLHGGLSTGPRTKEGKAIARANGHKPKPTHRT